MDCGERVCLRGLGHRTKMSAMPIYGKNPLKFFFSSTDGPMAMGLYMQHWGHRPFIVCSHDALG